VDHKIHAINVFQIESKAIANLTNLLTDDFNKAINSILATKGRTIICGMGKSGIIGKKIAATLASTGTPSFFMHPGEAFHGDLGMVTSEDIFLAISNSGQTEEVLKLLPFLRDNKNIIISLTGNKQSTLAKEANFNLNINVPEEACPLQLAPTSSTTATLAMGDALSIALMEARNFKPENFARFHPGGTLGRLLLSKVSDAMITTEIPIVAKNCCFTSIINTISKSKLGFTLVDYSNEATGIITDGDLRRAMESKGKNVFDVLAQDIATLNPLTISPDTNIQTAYKIMEDKGITSLLVNKNSIIIGVLKK